MEYGGEKEKGEREVWMQENGCGVGVCPTAESSLLIGSGRLLGGAQASAA